MKKLLGALIISLISTTVAFANTDLGNGYSCDGTTIFKGSKVVAYTKAKSTLQKTIDALKADISDATGAKKTKLKNKLNAIKSAKIQVTACFKGQISPNDVDQVFKDLAAGSGTYLGNYNGTVFGIPVSGTVQLVFTLQGTTFSATMSLGGNLGNTLNFQPLAFSNDVGGIGFPAQFVLTGTFLGTVTLSITQAGVLTITNNDNSKPINFNGTFASSSISGSLSGSYSSIPYNGTFTLNRQ